MAKRACAKAFIALAVALAAGCSSGQDTPTGSRPVPTTEAATAEPTTPAATIEPPGRDDHGTTAPAPPASSAATAAAAFAAAWARPSLPAEQWWQTIAPLCETGFAASLRTVDPALVPASRVTGRPVAARAPADGLAVYTVPTDAGALTVTVAVVDGQWLVTGNDFTRATR
jgi:hypothetical protein